MKVAVVGSRAGVPPRLVRAVVNSLPGGAAVVSGAARGVDREAARAARSRGLDVLEIPADWERWGRSAGIRRNADVVHEADAVVALWDGRSPGTRHTIGLARREGKPLLVLLPEAADADAVRQIGELLHALNPR